MEFFDLLLSYEDEVKAQLSQIEHDASGLKGKLKAAFTNAHTLESTGSDEQVALLSQKLKDLYEEKQRYEQLLAELQSQKWDTVKAFLNDLFSKLPTSQKAEITSNLDIYGIRNTCFRNLDIKKSADDDGGKDNSSKKFLHRTLQKMAIAFQMSEADYRTLMSMAEYDISNSTDLFVIDMLKAGISDPLDVIEKQEEINDLVSVGKLAKERKIKPIF